MATKQDLISSDNNANKGHSSETEENKGDLNEGNKADLIASDNNTNKEDLIASDYNANKVDLTKKFS